MSNKMRMDFFKKIIFSVVLSLVIIHHVIDLNAQSDKQTLYQLLKKAEKMYKNGSFAESEALCKQALEINDRFYPSYNLLGLIYAQKEGYEKKAIAYFTKSLEIYPNQITNYTNISALYNQIGKISESLPLIEQGLLYSPNNFMLNFNVGLIYLIFKQDPQNAIPYLENALKENPDDDRLQYLTGVSYLLTKEKVVALQFVTEIRRIGNEFLACELEDSIRRSEEGQSVNMNDVVKTYSSQSRKEKEGKATIVKSKTTTQEEKQPTPSSVEIGDADKAEARVGGAGTIQIRRRYRPVLDRK